MIIAIPRPFYLLVLMIVALISLVTCFVLQYVAHIPPCPLCIYERIPYAILFLGGLGGLCFSRFPLRALIWIFWITFLASTGLASYHVAIEYGILPSPSTCASLFSMGDIHTVQDFQNLLPSHPSYSCNEVSATFLSISLTAYNLLLSLSLLALLTVGLFFKSFIQEKE